MAQLEQACLNGEPRERLVYLQGEVERELAPVIVGLDALGEGAVAAPAAQGADPVRIAALVANVKQLLADSDTAAMDALSDLESLIGAHRLAGRLRQVSERAERFDFDEALALLNELDWAPAAR
ncbi:hypothetical protein LP420_28770 [Massilia sp. B-10]|nr:hypothetical protein LP420_28770 [Massilia sp. B-10]